VSPISAGCDVRPIGAAAGLASAAWYDRPLALFVSFPQQASCSWVMEQILGLHTNNQPRIDWPTPGLWRCLFISKEF
jgi:hypothetical protein